jgi:hypothetical protein
MRTFILLTFGFLGFAFYEMSGGSDFEPASVRMAKAASEGKVVLQAIAENPQSPRSETVDTASITKINDSRNDDQSVTRVALNLTNISTVEEASTIVPELEPKPETANIIASTETPQIILPSLIITPQSSTAAEQAAARSDIRSVSGNTVNVRDGPSTNYGVVNKLTRGAEVRILEDNGNGWVLMQPLDGGEAGWMADFLLTSG